MLDEPDMFVVVKLHQRKWCSINLRQPMCYSADLTPIPCALVVTYSPLTMLLLACPLQLCQLRQQQGQWL
jgi:hypothetical protein